MTTEDIRVIRPACESFLGKQCPQKAEMSTTVFNYFLNRPDMCLPMSETAIKTFILDLYNSLEFRNYLKTTKFKHHFKGRSKQFILDDLIISVRKMISSSFCETYDAIIPYFKKPEQDRNIYIFEGRFFEQFSKIDIKNLSPKHLPQEGCGCIVLPKPLTIKGHRLKIDEVIFSVGYKDFTYKSFLPIVEGKKKNTTTRSS